MRTLRLLILPALIATGLSGCIPCPHTSTCIYPMSGHVVDAETGLPIEGVSIKLLHHLKTEVNTDKAGAFHIERTINFHLTSGLGSCGVSDWPKGDGYGPWLLISHPDYSSAQIDAREYENEYVKANKADVYHFDRDLSYQGLTNIKLTRRAKPDPAQVGGMVEGKKAP